MAIPGLKNKSMTLKYILKKVSEIYQVPVEEIKSKCKKRVLVTPRHVYFILAHRYSNKSLSKIGAEINKSHCSVLHALKNDNEYNLEPEVIRVKKILNLN